MGASTTAVSGASSEIRGWCALCKSRCGSISIVEGDRFIGVRPDPAHPTGGAMCMKGRSAPEIVHSPHRILHPMRRTNPKGDAEPGWIRISWEEALSEVAERFGAIAAENGPEAVAFSVTTPSGTPLSDSIDWIERFIRTFGSPNMCYGTEICNWHKDFAHAFTFGCGMPTADYENADTIMLWGHNPANTWLAQADAIARGRAKGGKMLVIDPRPTALARQADVWLPVRPGTDAALALGLIRLILERKLYDEDFVRGWTNAPLLVRSDTGHFLREHDIRPHGASNRYLVWSDRIGDVRPYDGDATFPAHEASDWKLDGYVELNLASGSDTVQLVRCAPAFQLLKDACVDFDPLRVLDITGVAPDRLEAAVELLKAGKRISYHAWTGIGQHANATQSERAVATLYALTGSFDRVGGNRVRRGPPYRPVNALEKIPLIRSKALGIQQRPIGPPAMGWVTARDTYRAILEGLPYKIRGMMAFGTNMPVSQGDSSLAAAALEALEFHVHCDLFETPAARYADIFLPVNTPWEHEALRFGFEINDEAASLVQFRPKMVSARGESRSDSEIIFDLACRMGMAKEFFGGSIEAGWNYMLEPLGLSIARLREEPGGVRCGIDSREKKYAFADSNRSNRVRGFDTETQRVELYSEVLYRNGQPALATFSQPLEEKEPEGKRPRKYPIILSSAKNGYYCHSQHRSLVSLRKRAPDPIVELSPALAASRNIRDGDWIRVSTYVGDARFVAKITPLLADDVVVAEFGWWQACPELDRPELTIHDAAGSNFNSLISAEIADPVSGSVPMRSFRCNISLDPLTENRQRGWLGWRQFKVVEVTQEAAGAKGFVFASLDGQPLPDYRPGQHVEIRIDIAGVTVSRAYSLTGPAVIPGRDRYCICVRHQLSRGADGLNFEGRMSSYLHGQISLDTIVELKQPSGNFVVPRASPQPLVLLATGIGITPFMSLFESLDDGDPLDVSLYYANFNGHTHVFRERIISHCQRLPGLKVFNHYREPSSSDRLGIDYDSLDSITADLVPDEVLCRQPRIFMCGAEGVMNEFSDGLRKRGIPGFDIFREVFRSPPTTKIDNGRTHAVTFAASQRKNELWTAAEGPLLNFAERLGVTLPSGCRVGQCESCMVKIISGKVIHLHGHEPEDPSNCLCCQAVPTEDLVLDA